MITFKEWFKEKHGVEPVDYYKSYMKMLNTDVIHKLDRNLFTPMGVNDFELSFMRSLSATVLNFIFNMAFNSRPESVLSASKIKSVKGRLHSFICQDTDVLFGIARANDLLNVLALKYGMKITDIENSPCKISRCCTSFNDMVFYCYVHDKLRGTHIADDYLLTFDDLKNKDLSYSDRLKILQALLGEVS